MICFKRAQLVGADSTTLPSKHWNMRSRRHHASGTRCSWSSTPRLIQNRPSLSRRHGDHDERAVHLWQVVREHRHPAPVGVPLRHVGAGDREADQAGSGDQRAQEGTSGVPHPQGHHQGRPRLAAALKCLSSHVVLTGCSVLKRGLTPALSSLFSSSLWWRWASCWSPCWPSPTLRMLRSWAWSTWALTTGPLLWATSAFCLFPLPRSTTCKVSSTLAHFRSKESSV